MADLQTNGLMAVIGDRESVMLFNVLGLKTFPVSSAEETAKAIHKLAREGCAVIYITEEMAALVPEELARYRTRTCPAIIPIPGSRGSTGMGMDQIRENVFKAVGMDIL